MQQNQQLQQAKTLFQQQTKEALQQFNDYINGKSEEITAAMIDYFSEERGRVHLRVVIWPTLWSSDREKQIPRAKNVWNVIAKKYPSLNMKIFG